MPTKDRVARADGGPAFPRAHGDDGGWASAPSGMSLRDYFAAHALPAVYAHAMSIGCDSQDTIIAEAYELADTMLEERQKLAVQS